jgi:hypothetical protein
MRGLLSDAGDLDWSGCRPPHLRDSEKHQTPEQNGRGKAEADGWVHDHGFSKVVVVCVSMHRTHCCAPDIG